MRAITPLPAKPRRRVLVAVAVVSVIAMGLASRRFPAAVPAVFGKYPGDALWALMVYLGLAFVWPAATGLPLAMTAFGVAVVVEALQLYQAPWLVAIRNTTLGHLALGSTFAWRDIVAYAVGAATGALLDAAIARRRRRITPTA